jgi:hypothetical protein
MVRYINWRNDQLDWADNIVRHQRLKLPSGQSIRTWYNPEWESINRNIHGSYEQCRDALQSANIFEDPEEGLGPEWLRPHDYVAAALALTCKGPSGLKIKISDIVELK